MPIEILHCRNREFRVFAKNSRNYYKFLFALQKDVAVAETHFLTHYRLFYVVCCRSYTHSKCLLRSTTALSVMHHPAAGISFPRNFACLQISHMSVRLLLHHHCYHLLLLLTSTPDSELIFSINLFLHSSSTFPPTLLTPRTLAVFRFSRACRF